MVIVGAEDEHGNGTDWGAAYIPVKVKWKTNSRQGSATKRNKAYSQLIPEAYGVLLTD